MGNTSGVNYESVEHIQSEIYDMAEILAHIDAVDRKRSLIIVDELGGQTCNNQSITLNFALMWSISEFLLSLPDCLVVVSTHNHLLN
jgi:DNA mismatch repair ATPase MutS